MVQEEENPPGEMNGPRACSATPKNRKALPQLALRDPEDAWLCTSGSIADWYFGTVEGSGFCLTARRSWTVFCARPSLQQWLYIFIKIVKGANHNFTVIS